MTNNTALAATTPRSAPHHPTNRHIARTRRLAAVATAIMVFGVGAVALHGAGSAAAGQSPAPSGVAGTPTATTSAPAN